MIIFVTFTPESAGRAHHFAFVLCVPPAQTSASELFGYNKKLDSRRQPSDILVRLSVFFALSHHTVQFGHFASVQGSRENRGVSAESFVFGRLREVNVV